MYPITDWQPKLAPTVSKEMTEALESGQVLYLPKLEFPLEKDETALFQMDLTPKHAKNISYNPKNQTLRALALPETADVMQKMMQRYHHYTQQLLQHICPQYQIEAYSGRTSFRPIEIKGRRAPSYRKDDTRLHVDAFPSTPTNHSRILRVFTNINPYDEHRYWHIGEAYADVVRRFLPKIRPLFPLEAELLYRLKITRQKRLPYDHYMLHIHDKMKADLDYQQQVNFTPMNFPPGSTWIVYTDLVSHAALAGRFVLEQTYYPPVQNMQNPSLSPQYQLQQGLDTLRKTQNIRLTD